MYALNDHFYPMVKNDILCVLWYYKILSKLKYVIYRKKY